VNLIDSFEKTVDLFPDKLAIRDDNFSLSFKELRNKSKSVSSEISRKYDVINRPVAIYLPKSNEALVSMIGTLYSGNCYAPLDIKNPINRIESILRILRPLCVITDNKFFKILEKCNLKIDILNIDDMELDSIDDISYNYQKCIDMDPAYIIHTSGSTGSPKGVVISHGSVIDHANWMIDAFKITSNEIIGNQSPFIFDTSTLDIYLMIFTGATLHLISEKFFMFPANLLKYVKNNQINFICWVPSVYINIANLKLLDFIKLTSLKKVLFGGEVMPTQHLNYWIQNLNKDVLFANMYGPTEITVNCTYHIIDRVYKDNEVLPIGIPCRNSDILILNEENQLCTTNEQGELCVRGSSLSLGYWEDFEKSNSVFIQNPLNTMYPDKIYRTGDKVFKNEQGEIIFIGRKDFQIKHLGYRIELGEIEHSILSVFDSINGCVLYDDRLNEIVFVYESKADIPISEFRFKLNKSLAKYMIPTRYVKMDTMLYTNSGKIDRVKLKNNFL